MNIQEGSRIALANATNQSEICTRCEIAITGEVFVRDCEANAPYQPAPFCSLECVQAADEAAFEHVYSER